MQAAVQAMLPAPAGASAFSWWPCQEQIATHRNRLTWMPLTRKSTIDAASCRAEYCGGCSGGDRHSASASNGDVDTEAPLSEATPTAGSGDSDAGSTGGAALELQ